VTDCQSKSSCARRSAHAFAMAAFLPLSIAGSVTAFWWAQTQGGNAELAITLVSTFTLLLAMGLERLAPYSATWNRSQGDGLTDWLSFAALAGAVQPAVQVASPWVVTGVYAAWGPAAAWQWFPTEWPFAAQVVLALLLAELGKYWAHRWHHNQRHLWWLHAMHHSSKRLYTVNNFRFHPLNYVLNQSVSILPLMLLGTPAEVMLGYLALTQPVLMLQHANLPLRHGLLNYVLSTNTQHRWHHSTQPAEGDRNFGSALLLWDWVFRSYYRPQTERSAPDAIGLYAGSRYPAQQSYVQQLRSMFQPQCCAA
jgi:ornithine lipid hydroxylase